MKRRVARAGAAVLICVLAVVLAPLSAVAAPPAGACRDPEPARPAIGKLPWAQQVLDPRGVWTHSTGAGVVVAVVDSGVDVDHPQLRPDGKVLRGQDFFLVGDLPGSFDCVSHGTAVASIVAAAVVDGIGFHGVAPSARILPVRVTDADQSRGKETSIDPNVLARGIRYAADNGAKVINLSLAGTKDEVVVRDAVAYAQGKDALVIAAAGNFQGDGSAELPSFPAAYEGVLGVGAVDIAGARIDGSQIGRYVDLVAPGGGVLAATRSAGHTYWEGTSFAAPFVAGTAALVRSAWPELSAEEVARRLLATASPARGGQGSRSYGAGIVNPYRAVTEGLTDNPPGERPGIVKPAPDPAEIRVAAWWSDTGSTTRGWTIGLLSSAVVVLVVVVAVSLGRRRRWAPGRVEPPTAEPVRDEPPEQLFLLDPPPVDR
nr:type VII secretion-associated serine protease mycosin [Amycolatopsis marina]